MIARARLPLLAILCLAAALRFTKLDLPFVEPYNSLSRQAIVATVARNFYQHGFDFFYPEIDENGRGPYLYNAEMPIYSYLMAIGYKLSGGVNEWAARAVSALFSMGMLAFLYLFVRRLGGERAALAALALAAVSPLNLALSRSIQPEATLLFASVGAIYFLYRYSEGDGSDCLALSALFLAFAVATKIQSIVYLAPPLAYLAWRKDGAKFFRKPTYAILGLAVFFSLLWYAAMFQAGQREELIYTPYDFLKNRGPENVPYWSTFSPKYVALLGKYLVFHLLTPAGAVLAAVGLFVPPAPACRQAGVLAGGRRASNRVFDAWAVGVALYSFVFWRFLLDHSYYQLPLIPVAAYYAGRGFEFLVSRGFFRRFWVALAAGLLVLASVATSARFYPGIYSVTPELSRIVKAGEAVQRLTPQGSLVLANYGGSTIQLYYCNRKGWAFDIRRPRSDDALIEELEHRRSKGGAYFVTTTFGQLDEVPRFKQHLDAFYPVLERTGDYVIYDLRRSRSGEEP